MLYARECILGEKKKKRVKFADAPGRSLGELSIAKYKSISKKQQALKISKYMLPRFNQCNNHIILT